MVIVDEIKAPEFKLEEDLGVEELERQEDEVVENQAKKLRSSLPDDER